MYDFEEVNNTKCEYERSFCLPCSCEGSPKQDADQAHQCAKDVGVCKTLEGATTAAFLKEKVLFWPCLLVVVKLFLAPPSDVSFLVWDWLISVSGVGVSHFCGERVIWQQE